MTLKEAREPNSKVAIRCTSKKQAKKLCKAMKPLDPKPEKFVCKKTYFGFTKEATYYGTTETPGVICIASRETFLSSGYTIIPFEDIEDIEDFKKGGKA